MTTTTRSLTLLQIDAFTDVPFRGNPAAVVVLDTDARSAEWMQAVAAEMNLAETAFVSPHADGTWALRWFTPTVEVELCGHATLASAHALGESGLWSGADDVVFHTRSGVLRARRLADGRLELALPALEPTAAPLPNAARQALGLPAVEYSAFHPNGYWLCVLAAEGAVRSVAPDFAALTREPGGYIVAAPSDAADFDFVSRFFVPAHGIDEDPVTGAAHCVMAPYWSKRLSSPIVRGLQVSARTGVVECEPRGDRVLLRGHAVTVSRGELLA